MRSYNTEPVEPDKTATSPSEQATVTSEQAQDGPQASLDGQRSTLDGHRVTALEATPPPNKTVEPDQNSSPTVHTLRPAKHPTADSLAGSSPPPPNRTVLHSTPIPGGGGWGPYHPNIPQPQYKKQANQDTEMEDSVVSSTQDFEPVNSRYPDMGRPPYCPEESHRGRQDHFGSLIGMLSELQEASCTDLEQILGDGTYNQEIKTESDSVHLTQQNQTEVGYNLGHQDLYPSSYLRQEPRPEQVFRFSPGTCGEETGTPGLQYPTQLLHKGAYAPLSPSESKIGDPYSPISPGSPGPKGPRSKDEKYWERRRKNNLAAKKSRDARRVRENQLRLRVLCSENQIRVLRSQLDRSQEDNHLLRERLKKYEGESVQLPSQEGGYTMQPPQPDQYTSTSTHSHRVDQSEYRPPNEGTHLSNDFEQN